MVDIITRPDRFDSGSQIVVQREAEPVDGDAMLLAGIVVTIDGDKSFGALLLYAVRHSSGLLLGALIPLLIILLGAAGVIADDTAVWVALWIDAALLGIIGYLAVARMTAKPWARSLGALVTALLGVAIMVMKALIH